MTPKSWTEYAAAALARERTPQRCEDQLRVNEWGFVYQRRCTLRAGHQGAHR